MSTSLKEFRKLPFKIITFYLGSVVIISHQLAARITMFGYIGDTRELFDSRVRVIRFMTEGTIS